MAEQKKRQVKKRETVRERAEKASVEKKPRRIKQTVKRVSKPIKAVSAAGRKHYRLPIPLPDNRLGRVLGANRHVMPRFFREAWGELKQVVWPTRRETLHLTLAVFIFALLFGVLVWVVDLGLENIFRKVLID